MIHDLKKQSKISTAHHLVDHRLTSTFFDASNEWGVSNTLNEQTLIGLITGDIGAIVIPNWLSQKSCYDLTQAVESVGFEFYENVTPPIGRIGITQFECSRNKDLYFDKANISYRKQQKIFYKANISLLNEVFNYLNKTMGTVSVPREGGSLYFAGLIRQIRHAYLHFDYAPYDGNTWFIHRILNQLAWNIYIQSPLLGGELKVYDCQWHPKIFESHQMEGYSRSYGFKEETVGNCRSVTIQPKVGDFVLFNSRNFHQVLICEDTMVDRISVSSFLGQLYDGHWIAWS